MFGLESTSDQRKERAEYPITIYVGNLHPSVSDEALNEVFLQITDNVSCAVVKNPKNTSSKYGYANFKYKKDAEKALNTLNYTLLMDRPMRLMWKADEPLCFQNPGANVFINNLSPGTSDSDLYKLVKDYGTVHSVKIARLPDGSSKGYGYVQFADGDTAEDFIEKFDGLEIDGKKVHAEKFKEKLSRGVVPDKAHCCFVRNLCHTLDDAKLKEIFSRFGQVVYARILRDRNGISRRLGHVCFTEPRSAKAAIASLNNVLVNGCRLNVCEYRSFAELRDIRSAGRKIAEKGILRPTVPIQPPERGIPSLDINFPSVSPAMLNQRFQSRWTDPTTASGSFGPVGSRSPCPQRGESETFRSYDPNTGPFFRSPYF